MCCSVLLGNVMLTSWRGLGRQQGAIVKPHVAAAPPPLQGALAVHPQSVLAGALEGVLTTLPDPPSFPALSRCAVCCHPWDLLCLTTYFRLDLCSDVHQVVSMWASFRLKLPCYLQMCLPRCTKALYPIAKLLWLHVERVW